MTIPASPGRFSATSHTGPPLPPVAADGRGLTVTLTDAPQYLWPEQPDRVLRLAAALQRAPLDSLIVAPQSRVVSLAFHNPLAKPLRAGVSRDRLIAVAPGQTVTLEYRHPVLRDADAKVSSTQTMALAAPPAGPPQLGVGTLRIAYHFEKGWKFVRLAPREQVRQTIPGQPLAFGVWVHGDGSGNHLRCRLVDATGQTFQPDGGKLDWRGWRFVRFPLDGSRSGRWGGKDDGVIHYPLRWDTLLLIDSAHHEPTSGEVHIASPTLIFRSPG